MRLVAVVRCNYDRNHAISRLRGLHGRLTLGAAERKAIPPHLPLPGYNCVLLHL